MSLWHINFYTGGWRLTFIEHFYSTILTSHSIKHIKQRTIVYIKIDTNFVDVTWGCHGFHFALFGWGRAFALLLNGGVVVSK